MDWFLPAAGVLALLAAAGWVWNALAARTYRARLVNAILDLAPAGDPPPLADEVRDLIAESKELGFELLKSYTSRDSRMVVVLFNEPERSTGDIVDYTEFPGVEGLTVEITSILEGGLGALATCNTGLPSLHNGELRQTFPRASPRELVAHHQAAIELLRSRGLDSRPLSREEANLARQEWYELQVEHVRSVPARTVVEWIRDARSGYPKSAGSIADNKIMLARLDGILAQR